MCITVYYISFEIKNSNAARIVNWTVTYVVFW
jgi:hypothetical protein